MAAKAALAARIDYNMQSPTGEAGAKFREALERRVKQLASRTQSAKNGKKRANVAPKAVQNTQRAYDTKADHVPTAKKIKTEA